LKAALPAQQTRGIKASTKARRTLFITNPATGQVFKELSIDTPAAILRKFDACKNSIKHLKAMPLSKRKEAALKFADLLEKNAEHLGKVMTSETGKPITQVGAFQIDISSLES
jgi:acyl-CoA reductase-like NAD-dependent aldehyde dehydrogenase